MDHAVFRTSELRYRRLFETAQDGILLLDFKSGMITDVNKFLIDMLGYTKEEILKKYVWQIGFFRNEDEQKANLRKLQSKGYVRFENLPLQTKAGKKINVEFVANAYEVGEERVIQCNVRDITDRVIAEEKLKVSAAEKEKVRMELLKTNEAIRTSELRYRRLFETAQDGILLLDFKSGMITDVNKFLIDMLGYTKEEILKKYVWQIGFFRNEDEQKANLRKLQSKGYVRFENLPLQTKAGKKINVEFVANAYEVGEERVIQCNVRDITDRVIAEGKLKSSENKFAGAFLNMPHPIIITKSKDGKFIETNKAFLTLTGYSKSELIGNSTISLAMWANPKDREYIITQLQTNRNIVNYPCSFKKKNGEIVQSLLSVRKVAIDDESCVLANIIDVTKIRQIEKALKESEYFFRESQRVAAIGSYKFEIVPNSWESSEVLDKIFGIDQNYVKNFESWLDLVYPEDRKMMKSYFKNEVILKHRRFNQEYRIVRKSDKEIRWVRGLGRVDYDIKGRAVRMIGTIQDITKRRIAEDRDRWLASFPVLTPSPIVEIHKNKGLIYLNPSAKTLFPDLEQKQFDHPILKHLKRCFRDLHVYMKANYSREVKFLDRWYLQIFSSPAKDLLRIYFTDITSRKNAESVALDIKERDEAILESIGDAVFVVDATGKILIFNGVAEYLTGLSDKYVIGKNYHQIFNFVRESDGRPCNDFIGEAIKSGKVTEMANHAILVRRDGVKLPVADSAAPVRNGKGELMGCVVVFHETTKERQIDRAKTEFVSLASHQLRTPLSTINWYSEILLSEEIGKMSEKQKQYNTEIYRASQRMVALVNALLNVSRLELGTFVVEPINVDIVKIAKASVKEFEHQIVGKQIVLHEKYSKDVAKIQIKADPKLLGIVFQNLISNSIKYNKQKGKIWLTIDKEEKSMLICIADTGIGIPSGQQKEIFSKLFRADNAKIADPDGTGLGMYMVKEIIDYTGGEIWFESREGKGCKFYVKLPLSGMKKKAGTKPLI